MMTQRGCIQVGALCLSFMVFCGSSAIAADHEVDSRITAVTVFTRAAEVSRVADVSLPAGAHTVVLRDLPIGLQADSIRIEGVADGTLEIGSVDTRTVLLPEDESATRERKRIEKEIERLRDDQSELEDRIAAAETQKALIQNLTQLPQQPGSRDQDKGARSPADWIEISKLIAQQMFDASESIRTARIAMRDMERQIGDLTRVLSGTPPRRIQRTEVRVNVSADAALQATLTIRYQVANASWTPIYEARLASGNDRKKMALDLIRRARVSQRTGEEWNNILLTLSTARPRKGTAAPRVNTVRVVFRTRRVLRKTRSLDDGFSMGEAMPAPPVPESDQSIAESKPVKKERRRLVRRQARAIEAPFQAIYVIPGRHTIPTDGAVRRIEVDRIAVAPTLIVRVVPRKRTAAFIYTDFKVPDGQRILPGPVSLFRDGVFVGRGALPTLTSGEDHELGFGQDDTVRIEHITLTKKTGESGIISTSKTDTRQYRAIITNGHNRTIAIRVLDQIPVSGDEKIEVVMTSGTTAPTILDLDGKKGVLAWDFSLKAKAKKIINFGFRLSWPEGKDIRLREVRK